MAGKFILTVFAVVALLVNSTAAVTYTVGDSLGWTVPPSADTYPNWASPITFRVGDILVFNFAAGAHDVATVTKQAYDGCNTNSPLTMQTVGPVAFPLVSTGELNFICTFGSHCALGQKFSINVTSAAPSPPPTSVPVAPSPPTTLPSPPPPPPPFTTPVPVAPSPPMTRPSPPPSTTPVPAAPSPTTTPMPASPPSATPTTPAAPGSPSLPPSVSSMPPTQMPGGPTGSPSASPNSLPSPPPAGALSPGSSSTPPPSTTPTPPDSVSSPPPPSSATRSLTVVGFVGTLLTIAMGLTL